MHPKGTARRRHDGEFKAKVLAACAAPGASISAVALAHGLNANLVRKWRQGRGLERTAIKTLPSATAPPPVKSSASATLPLLAADATFLPVETGRRSDAAERTAAGVRPEVGEPATIDIELRRGAASLLVRWPVSAAGECAAWLGQAAAGVLK